MRYLHNMQLKNNETKGNKFICSQLDLAKKFYGNTTTENRNHINRMIHNLLDSHILDIWDKQASKNNGWKYNIYRLNS